MWRRVWAILRGAELIEHLRFGAVALVKGIPPCRTERRLVVLHGRLRSGGGGGGHAGRGYNLAQHCLYEGQAIIGIGTAG